MLSHLKPIWNLGYLLLPLIFQTVISAPVETQWTSWPRHQHRVFNESHLHPHTPITPDGYAADGLYHLTVLHTNDIHGHLAEFNRLGMDCLKEEIDGNLCYGGIARLKWVIGQYFIYCLFFSLLPLFLVLIKNKFSSSFLCN